jgi:hypothetical protein
LARVNSSAITARHPEVPNLIWVVIMDQLRTLHGESATFDKARMRNSDKVLQRFLTTDD